MSEKLSSDAEKGNFDQLLQRRAEIIKKIPGGLSDQRFLPAPSLRKKELEKLSPEDRKEFEEIEVILLGEEIRLAEERRVRESAKADADK